MLILFGNMLAMSIKHESMSPSSFIYAWIYINFVIGLVEGGISSEMFIKEE